MFRYSVLIQIQSSVKGILRMGILRTFGPIAILLNVVSADFPTSRDHSLRHLNYVQKLI